MKYTYEDAINWAKINGVALYDTTQEKDEKEHWTDSILLLNGITAYINLYFPGDSIYTGADLLEFITDEQAYKLINPSASIKTNVSFKDYGIDGFILINESGNIVSSSENQYDSISNVLLFQSKNTKSVKEKDFKEPVEGYSTILNGLQNGLSFGDNLTAKFLRNIIGMNTYALENSSIHCVYISGSTISKNATSECNQWISDLSVTHSLNISKTVQESLVTIDQLNKRLELKKKQNREAKTISETRNINVLNLDREAINSSKATAYQCFCYLSDYADFLSRSKEKDIFDEGLIKNNVRGAQSKGRSANKGMRNTLSKHGQNDDKDNIDARPYLDFWWLNNGVTIIANQLRQISPSEISLVNPQIVNGQQTSRQIFSARNDIFNKEWKIQIKLIIIPDELDELSKKIKHQIILGVNTQTPVTVQNIKGLDDNLRNLSGYISKESKDKVLLVVRNGETNSEGLTAPYEFILQMILASFKKMPGEARSGVGTIVKKHFDEVFTEENTSNDTKKIKAWINFIIFVFDYDNFFKSNWDEEVNRHKNHGDEYGYLGMFRILTNEYKNDALIENMKQASIDKEKFTKTIDAWHNFITQRKKISALKNEEFDPNKYTKSKILSIDLNEFLKGKQESQIIQNPNNNI